MSHIRVVEHIGSTNAELLADPTVGEGEWLVALRQDAGRGRQGRAWAGLDGNFFGSTVVELRPADPEAASLALVAGLALSEAVRDIAPGVSVQLKWPNDLLLDGAKLAGILLERSGDRVIAGFGVNLAVAPSIEGRRTASLDGLVAPRDFAARLAARFARLLGAWRLADASSLIAAWEADAHPRGTPLTVHTGPGETVSGAFDGLEIDGALRLKTADGVTVVRSGDVDLG